MVVTTTRFAPLTSQVALNFGLPECRVVVVDHPLGGTDEATVRAWGDGMVERLVGLFTRSGSAD